MPGDRVADDVVVVMPVYNEESVLASVLERTFVSFSRVVCVDDGSTDKSVAVARAAGAETVEHPVNLGQGAALMTGIAWALRSPCTRVVVTMDADGQHDPLDAVKAVELLRRDNLDVVLGSRFLNAPTGIPFKKRALLALAVRYTRLTTGLVFTDTNNGLRAIGRSAANRLELAHQGMAHASEIQRKIGEMSLSWAEVPTDVRYTHYSLGKGQSIWNSINIVFDLVWR